MVLSPEKSPRIKKVMKGYSYIGLENTLVYEQKINLTTLQNSDLIFEEIEELKEEGIETEMIPWINDNEN